MDNFLAGGEAFLSKGCCFLFFNCLLTYSRFAQSVSDRRWHNFTVDRFKSREQAKINTKGSPLLTLNDDKSIEALLRKHYNIQRHDISIIGALHWRNSPHTNKNKSTQTLSLAKCLWKSAQTWKCNFANSNKYCYRSESEQRWSDKDTLRRCDRNDGVLMTKHNQQIFPRQNQRRFIANNQLYALSSIKNSCFHQ